ncbi:hypothetical protein AVT_27705 (plasmid) [Bacillus tropicus]|uniref:hypothetical protein n=1 Tax=Bacillus TaxID=1386 RepID=UPI001035A80C|nr:MULTISPECIES: hypothetical protein [Bacillus]WBO93064.1 hypothetical protein AVT_27705 [Bacillus tropicus]
MEELDTSAHMLRKKILDKDLSVIVINLQTDCEKPNIEDTKFYKEIFLIRCLEGIVSKNY